MEKEFFQQTCDHRSCGFFQGEGKKDPVECLNFFQGVNHIFKEGGHLGVSLGGNGSGKFTQLQHFSVFDIIEFIF